jgi:hypothetical protein
MPPPNAILAKGWTICQESGTAATGVKLGNTTRDRLIALASVFHSENLSGATSGFPFSFPPNSNCRGGGNAASSLRDSLRYELSGTKMFPDDYGQILRSSFHFGTNSVWSFISRQNSWGIQRRSFLSEAVSQPVIIRVWWGGPGISSPAKNGQ